MCSIADDFTNESAMKPDIICWGCGKKEVESDKKFRQWLHKVCGIEDYAVPILLR